ncbi:MAG: bifunctional diaminohydroxyphosphoribosylaminopyrimidine deaminase/5-amino-6-(5-phosphoribosylamino)uracil reductase RibD [Campylobacterota bacterium]|nr:bifunctional diaminohydroxyphosphoribosylaminopyrimidine deaminase/5-amino-6-(5-phosphoribosylamino)uracil reductase RibD [Campylobacterota bacterium]
MKNKNSQFMQLAIEEAWKYQLLTFPNPAVGATVVKSNEVLSVEAHKTAGLPHAEVNALKSAYLKQFPNSNLKELNRSHEIHNFLKDNHNNFFKDCEIYVTLEPCNHIGKTPACSMLLESIGIKKVYIGTLDPNEAASGGKQRLENAGIEVEIDICKEETDELLYPFIQWQKDKFVFFKLAMREDGSIDGGYITTKDSLTLVHNIRTKLDLMIIGGQTVRVDRPTLDSRFAVQNKAPNIYIYSNKTNFDKTIPLFNIPNRRVQIGNNLEVVKNKNFIMIEGGFNLLNQVKNSCDYIVLFISHKKKFENKYNINNLNYKKVYSYYINEDDEIIFLRKL